MRYILFSVCVFFSVSFANPNLSMEELPRKGKDYALFFAVNQYDKMRDLSNPIKDAKAIANLLERDYDFEAEVVENPTLDKIEQTLKKYQKRFAQSANGAYQSSGQLLIYFTGHGVVEYQNGYFLPKDGDPEALPRTALAYNIWRPFINSINCKHILIAVDACYSGTFDPDWYSKSGFGRPNELSEGEKLLANHERYTTRKFFTSATDVRTPDNSKFTKKFLEGLQSGGGKDSILTHTELFTYLERSNPKPHYGDFGKWEAGSSFVFKRSDSSKSKDFSHIQGMSSLEKDLQTWRRAKNQNTISAYQNYLIKFPEGEFSELATRTIRDLEFNNAKKQELLIWEIAKEKGDFESYLEAYPNGKYVEEVARIRNANSDRAIFANNMILIKGGTFDMGCDKERDGGYCYDREKPLHSVSIEDFYIGKYEVTVREYLAFVEDTNSNYPEWLEAGNKYNIETGTNSYYQEKGYSRNAFNLPIVGVSWDNAVAYCKWLSENNNRKYYLPTEAEWEYAARGGLESRDYVYSGSNDLGEVAWYRSNSDKAPNKVGLKTHNELDIYDMSGNVWEWCADHWIGDYVDAPLDGSTLVAVETKSRVVRGGSWYSNMSKCRSAHRYSYNSGHRDSYIGFRVVSYE